MKASEIRFEEFLSQPKTNFLIPVYQRNYDWLNTQCNEFIKDIEVLARQEKDNRLLKNKENCHREWNNSTRCERIAKVLQNDEKRYEEDEKA